MTAVSAPFGLRAVRKLDGGSLALRDLPGGFASAYAANVFEGDPLKMATTGVLQLAAAGDTWIGTFVNVTWRGSDGRLHADNKWVSGTVATEIRVGYYSDKDMVYAIQAVGSVAQSAIGDAADWVAGAGVASSGRSNTYLTTLVGAASTAGLKVVGLFQAPDNAWGDTYTIVEVMNNEPSLAVAIGNTI